MKCKVCGTVNEDYLEYCENCAALLPTKEELEEVKEEIIEEAKERTAEEIYESRKGWTFVAAPTWHKVEFDANTITEETFGENDKKIIFSAPVASLTKDDLASTVDETAKKLAAQKEVAERAALEAAKRASLERSSRIAFAKEKAAQTAEVKKPTPPAPVREKPVASVRPAVKEDTVTEDTTTMRRPLSAVRKPLAPKPKAEPIVVVENKISTKSESDLDETKVVKTKITEEKPVVEAETEVEKTVIAPPVKVVEEKTAAPSEESTQTAPAVATPPVTEEVKPEPKKAKTESTKSSDKDSDFAPDEFDEDYDEYYDDDDKKSFSLGQFFANIFKKRSKDSEYEDDDEEEYKRDNYKNDEEYDPEDEDRDKVGFFKRFKKTILVAAISIVVVLAVVFLSVTISNNFNGNWSRFFSYTFGSYPLRKPATIETEMLDDEPARIITVYAKKGHKIRFMDEVYEVTGDLIQFRVSDQLWMPSEPVDAPTIDVTPSLTVIAPDGTETPVEFENSITITLPTLELNVTTPSITDIPSASGFIDFVGSITDLTASVFINDVQVQVDASGNFSARYSDLQPGANILNVEARKNGYQIARKTYTVNNGAPVSSSPATLALSFNPGEGRFRTTTDQLTVSGNMEMGAIVAVSGATLVGEVTQDANAGTFSFTVHMPEIKVYPVNVTVTKDGVAYTKPIHLERAPEDSNAYMEATTTFNYSALTSNPTHEGKYMARANVVQVIETDPYFKIRVSHADGEFIVCYYNNLFTAGEFAVGSQFKFYGEPHGTDSETGLPMLHVWYIKKSST